MTRPLRTLYVALFLGVLVLLFLWSMRGVLSYQPPNQFSVLDGGLAKTFESHYDKQFPVKEIGTNVWAAIDYLLFDAGRPGVVIGEHDWLYSDEEFKPVANGPQQQRDNLALIRGVRDELAQRNVLLLLAIVPAKSRVYPEHIGAHRPSALRSDLYQRFHRAVRRADIAAPDLLATLRAAKHNGPLFLRTDTHWTPLGADLAAQQLSAAVRRAITLDGAPQQFITEASGQERYQGDLTRFLPLDPLFAALMPEPDPLHKRATRAANPAEGADALFAASEMPVALVGTSYSANPSWNFAGALRQHLQRDLSNHAEDGQGPILPMLKYLQSEELKNTAPQLVIWEFPERYLPMASDLSDFDPAWIAELKSNSSKQRLASSNSH
ncbi:alginate O-acetyltransferase [Pseudomonas sp. UBA2684]|uniref:alginate O-acetyltransferase n=1 Tax=Pseudomonas sp. UBA2684 TaxID=1947311 RepID=UPI000E8B9555|nr:alginate O-acetyltransferase [Pseudomonas sp. UBA2684]HBX55648.1 alginate O-acetyltransferase [Pseudomonas sp.]|tara:strand:- start:11788 stop:12930 length:1143 start_codon:yes stop_codon:yes gene_type:complete